MMALTKALSFDIGTKFGLQFAATFQSPLMGFVHTRSSGLKCANTVLFVVMTIVTGLLRVFRSPVQAWKSCGAKGVAVNVTVSPLVKLSPVAGQAVHVPPKSLSTVR